MGNKDLVHSNQKVVDAEIIGEEARVERSYYRAKPRRNAWLCWGLAAVVLAGSALASYHYGGKNTEAQFSTQIEAMTQEILVPWGYTPEELAKMTAAEKLQLISKAVPQAEEDLEAENKEYSSELEAVKAENSTLKQQADELQKQKDQLEAQMQEGPKLTFAAPKLTVDGKEAQSGEKSVAMVDGTPYYAGALLDAHAKSKLVYDAGKDLLTLTNPAQPAENTAKPGENPGETKPSTGEGVRMSQDMIFKDKHCTYIPQEQASFSIANISHDRGVIMGENASIYLQLQGQYSSMTFDYGHVDDSVQHDSTLYVYAVGEDGEYSEVLAEIPLHDSIPAKTAEVSLVSKLTEKNVETILIYAEDCVSNIYDDGVFYALVDVEFHP